MSTFHNSQVVKIAVELQNHKPQLFEFDQRTPLSQIIKELCNYWNILDDGEYALQFREPTNKHYVTEKNRNKVKNGSMIRLHHSPTKTANEILTVLKSGTTQMRTRVLKNLVNLSLDRTFALEFVKGQGTAMIMKIIENEESVDEIVQLALMAFVDLMKHEPFTWDIIQPSFIRRNVYFVIDFKVMPDVIVQCALSILRNVVRANTISAKSLSALISFNNLFALLQDSCSQMIHQNTIALINVLFQNYDDQQQDHVASVLRAKPFRLALLYTAIGGNIGILHELYVMQTLTLGLIERNMKARLEDRQLQSDHVNIKISELRRSAFITENDVLLQEEKDATFAKKLSFISDIEPAEAFMETPCGMLALDCIMYFARNYKHQYGNIIHKKSRYDGGHVCPFGSSSVQLIRLICEILEIGKQPSETGHNFHPMLLTHDHPFEEFFCVCIIVVNKTWNDMRATNEDFTNVFRVVREQIERSLNNRPINFDDFRSKIQLLTYANITALRQQERSSKEEFELTVPAITNLKQKISLEIVTLIREQRLRYLMKGTRFSKLIRGVCSKNDFWYARLSPNRKVIQYGDCYEKIDPASDELCNMVTVTDMKQLLVGKECPHMKEIRNARKTPHLAFSITFDDKEDTKTLDFVASDEVVFNYWTDGINVLLGQSMVSKQKDDDFTNLMSIEIKLRLLDVDGVDVPIDPLPIPDDPDNYDFDS